MPPDNEPPAIVSFLPWAEIVSLVPKSNRTLEPDPPAMLWFEPSAAIVSLPLLPTAIAPLSVAVT